MTSEQPLFLKIMHQDHLNFVHLLAAFTHQVEAAEAGHRPSYHVLKGVLQYFDDYPRQIHHPREEMLIETMKDRVPDAEGHAATIIREHRALAGRIADLESAIDNFAANPATGREAFLTKARQFIAAEKQHIYNEEQYLFPAALAHLTADDWAWVNSGLGDTKAPLFGEAATERFTQLRQSIFATDRTYRISR